MVLVIFVMGVASLFVLNIIFWVRALPKDCAKHDKFLTTGVFFLFACMMFMMMVMVVMMMMSDGSSGLCGNGGFGV